MIKKLMALLLTGCLALQPVTGIVQAADFSSGPEVALETPAEGDQGSYDVPPEIQTEPSQEEPSIDVFPPEDQSDVPDSQDTPETPDSGMPEDSQPAESETPSPEATEAPNPDDSVQENPEASDPGLPDGDEPGAFDDEAAAPGPEEEQEEPPVPSQSGLGTIQVKLISMLPFTYHDGGEEGINVTVSVDGTEKSARISGKAGSQTVSFDNLQPGEHVVTVKANKFATYTQTISVGSNTINKIEVATANVETGVSARPGWLCLGDITGDGIIDTSDVTSMIQQIRSGEYNESSNLATSVSEDGVEAQAEKIDIADLQYLVRSMNENYPSSVTKTFVPPKEAVKVPEGTKEVDPEAVQSILSGEEGNLSLGTANNEPISPDNPVGIEFSLSESNEDAPVIEGITIETPVVVDDSGAMSSNIADGTVEYTYVEGGEEKTGYIVIGNGQIPTPEVTATPEVSVTPETSVTPEASVTPEVSQTPEGPSPSPETSPSPEATPEATPTTTPDAVPSETPEATPTTTPEEPAPTETPTETPPADISDSTDMFTPEEPSISEPAAETEPSAFASFLSFIFPLRTVHAEDISPSVSFGEDGSLIIDFGTQVAVKKVSLRITGTKKNQDLVDIAKVEFVNDMDQKIPAPELSVPELSVTSSANEEFTVSWTAENNITGYDLFVQGPVKKESGTQTQIIRIAETSHTVIQINDKPIKNFASYTVKVRSVNGDWTSPWSTEVSVTPRPTSVPAAPDNVTVKPAYRAVNVSWKMMDDAEGYMVYYRAKKEEDAGSAPSVDDTFTPVVEGFKQEGETGEEAMDGLLAKGMMVKNNCTITDLEDGTSYFIYVVGWNACGWGAPSIVTEGSTNGGDVPKLPEYHLINKSDEVGHVSPVIIQALHGNHGNASMKNSPIDQQHADTPTQVQHTYWAYGTVDNNYESYWEKPDEWDDGISYLQDNYARGITITLDKDYQMSYLTFTAANLETGLNYARILYWNEEHGEERQEVKADLITRTDDNQNPYYIVRFHEPINARRVMLCLGTGWQRINMRVGEIHFHSYSEIEGKIYGLYADDMHSQLVEGVNEEKIAELETELDVPDEETKELHPLYDYLKLELQNARDILSMGEQKTYQVETGITYRKDGSLNYSGLNSWQPLGKVVYAGEKINVFVGHNFKKVGETAEVNLVFTQFHSESNALCMTKPLKVGKNEFEVPRITNSSYEKGGQIYVEYTGNSTEDQYGIRVQGGVTIPVLNLYNKNDEEKTAAITQYVSELEEYVNTIETKHNEIHTQNETVNYQYKEQDCILNATDIMMNYMMYSVPATQVLKGAQSHGANEVEALKTSLDAMEQTMILFYQHKGLTNMDGNAKNGGNNRLTARHLNIRYMRMFAGAFMYASGNHIGIEYPQTTVASGASSWDSFGWGIAHEIGHDINDGRYAIAEITNNYFAQLLTINNGLRFKYPDVYKKVTSGEIGRSSDGAVQLALYWQLHLAFDPKEDRHIFNTYDEMFNNLFFARVDTYSRNPGNAPKPLAYSQDGTQVNLLNSTVDQNLMRLSCAAANANILPFFVRWGMVPDETTISYAQQYGEPTAKALYYVNEKARGGMRKEGTGISGQDVVNASVDASSQYATLTINSTVSADQILGYEIIRGTYTDGSLHKEVVGFAPCDADGTVTYVDKISTMNNRVMYYEVKAVDTGFNYSNPASAGSVKIETGGALNKDNWAIEADMIVSNDDLTPIEPDVNDPDRGFNLQQNNGITHLYPHTIDRVIDGDPSTAYVGQTIENASIVIDLKSVKEVTSLKYYGNDISSVEIDVGVPNDAGEIDWVQAKTGNLENGKTLWFNPINSQYSDRWIGTYDARYVCIKVPSNHTITVNEIDICGPSGDNVQFGLDSEPEIPTVGILSEEYTYSKEGHSIPSGSLVFIGKYKGNPAFNVVILYDENGDVVGVKDGNVASEQIILAPDPGEGNLGETSDGTWIYYIEPENLDLDGIKQIKQVRAELYRVDEAHTLAGERVVSDTEFFSMPEELPSVTFTGGKIPGAEQ